MFRFSTPVPPRLSIETRAGTVEVDTAETDETTVELVALNDAKVTHDAIAGATVEQRGDAVNVHLPERFGSFIGRVPEPALALVDLFRLRALALPLRVTRLAWRADRYVVEFADRVALEACFARGGAQGELRHLRTGVAHLIVPERERDPSRAMAWLEAQLVRHHERERRLHGADAR